jgi:hypothetical protein
MKKKPFIYAVAHDRKALMAKFGVCAALISSALVFKGSSILQRRVRSYAVNRLGCKVMNL